MGNPFTATTVSSYNANPPADDGSQVASNLVAWATQKSKLADPIKSAFDTSETATNNAFAKIIGGGGITTTAVDYTVLAADQGKFVKCTVSGKTITTPDATVVGSPFVFSVTNTSNGGITVAGNNPGVQQTIDGVSSFSLPAGAGITLNTDGTNWFTQGQNFNGVVVQPQGRLTLQSGQPVMVSETTAATSVFYSPYIGNLCPVYDGTKFVMASFSEQTLTLQNSSTYAASTIFDIFGFLNSGVFTIGIGPAWTTSTAGAGARGTGAGTTELQRLNGLWTNKVSMTAHNGATAYTVAANQGTYLGSIFMDGTNGQVSCHLTYGTSRKFGIWNSYNRVPICLRMGDSTSTWNYTSTWRQSRAQATNTVTHFTGLKEDFTFIEFRQWISPTATAIAGDIGIGINSTTSPSGFVGHNLTAGANAQQTVTASYQALLNLGIDAINSLEQSTAGSTTTFNGAEQFMLMTVRYNG